jgi:glycine dehydrogenase subunit 2
MAGFKVVEIPSSERGTIDIKALESAVTRRTAGIMLTNPNTLGIFEDEVEKIADIIHSVDGLLYYDGANLNAILGKVRPGDMGFDIVHLNLHKTFGAPHGGGGPGAGPICVKSFLREFLPVPIIEYKDGRYVLNYSLKHSIGKIHGYMGNIAVLLKAYIYIRLLGGEGLKKAAEYSVLNANYLFRLLTGLEGVEAVYDPDRPRKHEFVVSVKRLKDLTGVSALDIAKRLLDNGIHAPTIYFPLIVKEALMFEPTENLSKRDLDEIYRAMKAIVEEAFNNPGAVKEAPRNTAVARIKEAEASRPKTMIPSILWLWRKGGNQQFRNPF